MTYSFKPIGIIHSCYKEKFGTPRQARLVTEAKAQLELVSPYAIAESVRELENFSHLWIIFVFHQTANNAWKSMVRPPRLGGNQRVGVFASRSPFRPNPIGMSLVELEKIETVKNKVVLHLQGADLLDQTPVLDIKPYLPYADSVDYAQAAYAASTPTTTTHIDFTEKALQQCQQKAQKLDIDLQTLIIQILQQDPRPSYKTQNQVDNRIYAMKLYDFDLHWVYQQKRMTVLELVDEF